MIPAFRKKLIMHVGVSLGIVAALFAVVFLLRADIVRRSERIAGLQSQLAFRREAIQSFVELRVEFEQAEPYISVLEGILPDQNELIGLPKNLRALAAEEDVELNFAFGPESPPQGDLPGYVQFQMSAGGAFSRIIAFLRKVETGPYFISIDTFEITSSGGVFSATMNGRAFSK